MMMINRRIFGKLSLAAALTGPALLRKILVQGPKKGNFLINVLLLDKNHNVIARQNGVPAYVEKRGIDTCQILIESPVTFKRFSGNEIIEYCGMELPWGQTLSRDGAGLPCIPNGGNITILWGDTSCFKL